MMSSPEEFYEYRLKGKNIDQVISVIRGLKCEIGRLKNILEHPEYTPTICPSESTQLWCNRLYLAKAKTALEEIGGTYPQSNAEIKADKFTDNIPYISEIIFNTGSCFGRKTITTLKIADGKIYANKIDTAKFDIDDLDKYKVVDTDINEFCEQLKDLYIGEWRKDYNLQRFDYCVLDGTEWNLTICFSNGHRTIKKHGSNAYPYNFKEFLELLEIAND